MSSIKAQTVAAIPSGSVGTAIAGLDALPKGFPISVPDHVSFVGQDFVNNTPFIYHLTDSEVVAIKQALEEFKKLGLCGTKINKESFDLSALACKVQAVKDDVYNGRGFAVIRGLNLEEFTIEDITMIYMGLNNYIADKIGRQDKAGNALVHIIADKAHGAHHRHSTDAITFHTEENGEILSWLTRGTAAKGGACILASAGNIYNTLVASRPDVVRTLAAGNWPFAFPKFTCRPILFSENGKLMVNFGRAALIGSISNPRNPCLPTITEQQKEALDVVEAVARANEVSFVTQPGDIHFVNNMTVLHRRDGFVNDPENERHLVRMRLHDSTVGSNVPEAMQREWEKAFGDAGDRTFHIEPVSGGVFPLRMYPN